MDRCEECEREIDGPFCVWQDPMTDQLVKYHKEHCPMCAPLLTAA